MLAAAPRMSRILPIIGSQSEPNKSWIRLIAPEQAHEYPSLDLAGTGLAPIHLAG
ncbi:hypothetical protein GCM10009552_09450 [Rothia nasimurium]